MTGLEFSVISSSGIVDELSVLAELLDAWELFAQVVVEITVFCELTVAKDSADVALKVSCQKQN